MHISLLGRAALALVIVGFAFAAPRSGSPENSPSAHTGAHRLAQRSRMQPHRDAEGRMMHGTRHESQTENWSGYFVANYQTGSTYLSAQSNWTIPDVSLASGFGGTGKSNNSQVSSSWVGIGGTCEDENCFTSDNSLIQLGTEQDIYRDGSTDYYAWYEALPADTVVIPYPVSPGDQITASLACTSACSSTTQSWTLSMTDYTAGWSWTQTVSYASSELSVEWIEEATSTCPTANSCTIGPLDDFNKVNFLGNTANGQNPFLTLAQNSIQMVETTGQTAAPSVPQTGDNFTDCWGATSSLTCAFAPPASALEAAVLPSSRSVELGATATAFATIINSGTTAAQDCTIALGSDIPGTFTFQTTDAATNAPSGTPNTPVDIAASASQSFVLSFTPSGVFSATDTDFQFGCGNVSQATITTGLDTLLLSASSTPVPDLIVLAVTQSRDGILDIAGTSASAAFAVATANVGASADGSAITVTADDNSAGLPVAFTLCQTDPVSGQCLVTPTSTVLTSSFNAGATPTFAIFATASGAVPFAPATNRIFVRFTDASGNIRGETSVAVRTD